MQRHDDGDALLLCHAAQNREQFQLCLLYTSNFASGGQVLNTYEVDNYPGLPGISGMDLGSTLRAHAEKMGAEFSRERVKELVLDEEIKIVRTRKNEYHAKTVILATGAEHRALNVPGEKELSGMGVSYCATCDGAFFKDKTLSLIHIWDAKSEKTEKEDSNLTLYTFYSDDEKLDYTEVVIDNDLKLVRSIKVVHNQPEAPEEEAEKTSAEDSSSVSDSQEPSETPAP